MKRVAIVAGALVVVLVALFANARRLLAARGARARTTIRSRDEHITTQPDGAVRSVQAADLELAPEDIDRLWSAPNLERLARTYWRFLTRITLGAVRVRYRPDGRDLCLLGIRALPLLRFRSPEYELGPTRGVVRWRIASGLLVSRRGRDGRGYLQIEVRRDDPRLVHVEVEVASFYPAIASGLGRWAYENTQSRVHVIVTHGFLRSLARLKLAESRVGLLDPGVAAPG